MLLTWNSASSVGVQAMDAQHSILMDALNDLRERLVQGADHEQVCDSLSRIVEYTRQHFANEEQLLEQHGYPELGPHRAAHRRLLQQIAETTQRIESGEPVEISSLISFLRHWFNDHIELFDQRYGAWLNERGIF